MFSATELKRLDWVDIVLHVGFAVAIALLGWWFDQSLIALVVNIALWPVREFLQKFLFNEDYCWNFWGALGAIVIRPQPLSEWLLPVIAGFSLYGILA